MKVLHVIPSIEEKFGGPAFALLEMAKFQRKEGIDVTILTTGKKTYCHGEEIFKFRSGTNSFRFSFGLARWLLKNINNYDLVHIHTIFSFPVSIAAMIARIKSVPYIIRPCGQLCYWPLSQKGLKKEIYYKLIEKNNVSRAKFLHFTTAAEKKNLGVRVKTSQYILGLGVSTKKIISAKKLWQFFPFVKGKKILLYLGRIHPQKGLDLLLDSLPIQKMRDNNWILVIAGMGNQRYLKLLKQKIAKNHLEQLIYLIGSALNEKKQLLFQESNLLVLPSYFENFGLVVAEALSSSLPVAISNQVALATEVKKYDSGITFTLNQEIIKKALSSVIDGRIDLKSLSKNALKQAEDQFDWGDITEKQVTYYKKIIADSSKMNQKSVNLQAYKKPMRQANWFLLFLWIVASRIILETRFPWPYALKGLVLRMFGSKIGKSVVIKPKVKIKNPWLLAIGDYSWIGESVWMDNLAHIGIGKNCCISQGVYLETGNHNYKSKFFELMTAPISIKDGAWVGAQCRVCPGVTIGNHSVVTIGSTVTKNTEPYFIYQGNPAEKKKKRIMS